MNSGYNKILAQTAPRILLVCLDNLGDLVFCSSLLEPLLKQYPTAKVSLFCKSYAKPLSMFFPGVSEVFAADPFWDAAPGQKRGSMSDFFSTLREVGRSRYDLILVASKSWKAAAAMRLIPAGRRIGFDRSLNRWFLSELVPYPSPTASVLFGLKQLLQPCVDQLPEVSVYHLDRSKAENYVKQHTRGVPEEFVCLHPFAGSARRCMALDKWLQLAEYLQKNDQQVLWFGSAGEMQLLKSFYPSLKDKNTVAEYAQGDLSTSLALLSRAKLFIGHDSGPLHVTAAFAVPCIGLYLPGEPKRTYPQGKGWSQIIVKQNPEAITVAEIIECIERK